MSARKILVALKDTIEAKRDAVFVDDPAIECGMRLAYTDVIKLLDASLQDGDAEAKRYGGSEG